MPAQGGMWALRHGGGGTATQGHGQGEQSPVHVQGASPGFAAPVCWTFLGCSGEVWLAAGTCGVSVPAFGGGMEGWLRWDTAELPGGHQAWGSPGMLQVSPLLVSVGWHLWWEW